MVCPACRSCSRPACRATRRRSPTSPGGSGSRRARQFYKITIVPDDGGEEVVYDKLSKRQRLRVFKHEDGSERLLADGDHVEVGQQLMEGSADPHEVLRVQGPREVQIHLVKEVQEVYRAQGVSIHDKHIEVIVRQMLRRVTIIDSGATEFLPGSLTERAEFEAENRRVVAEGGEPAAGRPVLMGITKASLATDSWLSAASFQETTRVLTDAAINCRSDKLQRSEGERDHRQADPGRYRHQPLPQHPGAADRGGPRRGVHDPVLRGSVLQPGLRPGHRCRGSAGRLRLSATTGRCKRPRVVTESITPVTTYEPGRSGPALEFECGACRVSVTGPPDSRHPIGARQRAVSSGEKVTNRPSCAVAKS